jgi:hypothetical protein
MFGVKRAIGGHPVDHQIDQQGQPVLCGTAGERANCLGGGLPGLEYRMKTVMVADHLSVAGSSGLEKAADQRVIEAQRGCMRELRRPCIERPNQK